MDLETVLKLIDAGYTKTEITAFAEPDIPEDPPAEDQTQSQTEETAQEPDEPDPMTELKNQIMDLRNIIQSRNRMTATSSTTPAKTADDVIKELIEGVNK